VLDDEVAAAMELIQRASPKPVPKRRKLKVASS